MHIEDLNEKIRKCKKCRLWNTRTNVLCGEGNLNAELMLVAQAPGEHEDTGGQMFIGPSGKVLDELLRESGINRKEIYMTNLIKCMLPKYRKPKQDEIKTCSQYLEKEMKLIDPAVISPLGYYATRYIFEECGIAMPETKPEFPKICGKLFLRRDKKIFPLPHPAALLYNDSLREEMINNYRKLKVLLMDCK